MLVPLLMSLGLAAAATVLFYFTWRTARARRRVKATVVSLSVGSNRAGSGYGISPVFEYHTDKGKVVRAGAVRHGNSSLMPKLGDVIEVFVDPSQPQQVSIERPAVLWALPLGLMLLSLLWLYLALLEQ